MVQAPLPSVLELMTKEATILFLENFMMQARYPRLLLRFQAPPCHHLSLRPDDFVCEDLFAASRLEGSLLEVQVLVVGRNAGAAD